MKLVDMNGEESQTVTLPTSTATNIERAPDTAVSADGIVSEKDDVKDGEMPEPRLTILGDDAVKPSSTVVSNRGSVQAYADVIFNKYGGDRDSALSAMAIDAVDREKGMKQWKRRAVMIAVFSIFIFGCIFGLMLLAVWTFKDAQVESALLTNKEGDVVQTAPALLDVALEHSVVLDMKHLSSVKDITYKVVDPDAEIHDEEQDIIFEERFEHVVAIAKTPDLVVYTTAVGNKISVGWIEGSGDFRSWVEEADDSEKNQKSICASMQCSQIKVKDADFGAAQLQAKFQEKFNKKNGGRRLWWSCVSKTVCEGLGYSVGNGNTAFCQQCLTDGDEHCCVHCPSR